MKRGRLYSIGFILFSVTLMAGLAFWYFSQSRRHMLAAHAQGVARVSTRVRGQWLSDSRSLQDVIGLDRGAVRRELAARADIVGAYWFDVRTHVFERWGLPSYARLLRTPDARIVVTQL